MLTKGLKLFTTSPTYAENVAVESGKGWNLRCCECCTSVYFLGLCKPICKYRRATYGEFVHHCSDQSDTERNRLCSIIEKKLKEVFDEKSS